MYKDIILLTTSKKINNLCIAGVEKENGSWVRIISEDEEIQHAITTNDAMYEDGSMPQIMDIIRIKCKGYKPNYYQPENYVLDDSYYWKKVGTASIRELLRVHPVENNSFLFYDTDKCIERAYFNNLNDKDRYSLTLISPEDICVHVKQWSKHEKKKVTMSFNYSGNRYWYIRLTDTEFENIYLQYQDGNYNYREKCLLVVSLGDVNPKDNKHYKLIAKVLNIK
ncbi:hypothetical protein [Pelotomaculum sp. PtaB.Bin117]|uniref:dual OB domain-containing protein n=1 Tax=Pelotomaculum sp. PtaB.Bin117 TaxID=1811694 RepID=UPI0009CBBBE0|nr:hypothetical protein [Pelotomaculum sp. PtaB.Bin117]OPX85320.1 MAG: hypothetical protein A4E54_02475 [Pelotomaculum sp. PtaB.Bin117]